MTDDLRFVAGLRRLARHVDGLDAFMRHGGASDMHDVHGLALGQITVTERHLRALRLALAEVTS